MQLLQLQYMYITGYKGSDKKGKQNYWNIYLEKSLQDHRAVCDMVYHSFLKALCGNVSVQAYACLHRSKTYWFPWDLLSGKRA